VGHRGTRRSNAIHSKATHELDSARDQAEQPSLEVPEEPTIAVLPFTNMSGHSDQEFFADGLTEDIITGLSSVRGLMVIARGSTFVYKGRVLDLRWPTAVLNSGQ